MSSGPIVDVRWAAVSWGEKKPAGLSAAQATQAALAYLYTGRRERETLESSRGEGREGARRNGDQGDLSIS